MNTKPSLFFFSKVLIVTAKQKSFPISLISINLLSIHKRQISVKLQGVNFSFPVDQFRSLCPFLYPGYIHVFILSRVGV